MALTRTNIIGRITLPDDTNPVNSVVRFVMTGFDTDDTENATIIQIPIDAAIDALGDIDVNLWPNPLGVRTTFYSTYARIPDGNTNDVISIYLGQISVPSTGGPYDLNDLLPISPPAGATVADYIAQLAAAVASTEADAIATAADATQTALDRVATGADVVAAEAAKNAALAAAATIGATPYETKAALDAVTPGVLPAYGYVYADATLDDNGLYVYPTGGVAWVKDAADITERLQAVDNRVSRVDGDFRFQNIGIPGTIPDGTSSLTGSLYNVFDAPVRGPGLIRAFRLYANAATTLTGQIFTRGLTGWILKGSSFPIVVPDIGFQSVALNIPLDAGDYIGVRSSTTLRFSTGSLFVDPRTPGDGYFRVNIGDLSYATSGGKASYVQRYHFGWDVEYYAIDDKSVRHVIDIRGSDKITILGDSYGTDISTLRSKPWQQRVSDFTDWPIENFGQSGRNTVEQTSYIQGSFKFYGEATFREYGSTYALIRHGENDGAYAADKIDKSRQLVETALACGVVPIVSTAHVTASVYGDATVPFFKAMAKLNDSYLLDGIPHAQFTDPDLGGYGVSNPLFWTGPSTTTHHLGVRSNDMQAYPVEEFLNESIGRPWSTLRIFRHRPDKNGDPIVVAGVDELKYSNNRQRAKLWQEIDHGHDAIITARENLYDDLSNLPASSDEPILSEYLALQMGNTIPIPAGYALVEAILPALGANVNRVSMRVSDPAVTVYVHDALYASTGYPAVTVPSGHWRPLEIIDGRVTITAPGLTGMIWGDKIKFLIYKATSWSMNEPVIECDARSFKQKTGPLAQPKNYSGTELVAELFPYDAGALAAGWSSAGVPVFGTGPDDPLRGQTGHVDVTSTDTVSYALTYAQDDFRDREVEIEVWGLAPRDVFDSADIFPTNAAITSNSHDYETVVVSCVYGANSVPFYGHVTPRYRPVRFRTIAPRGTTGFTVNISAEENTVRIARLSAVIS